MLKRIIFERQFYLLASFAAAVSYFFVADDPLGEIWLMVWKGAGVGFLALYAARWSRGTDGWLIALVMTFGALGDIFLEIGLFFGGPLFAAGHVIAIALYLRNRRKSLSTSQKLASFALLSLTPLIAGLMTYPLPSWQIATGYSLLVGAMAAAAWISAFSRYRVGIGAVMFVISDLLIFGEESGHIGAGIASWLIWPLYYSGQFLITIGVVQTLRQRHV